MGLSVWLISCQPAAAVGAGSEKGVYFAKLRRQTKNQRLFGQVLAGNYDKIGEIVKLTGPANSGIMAAEILKIHPENPEMRKIGKVASSLQQGGVVIYPTDTVYGIGCDLHNRKGIQKLIGVLGIKPNKLDLSFICHDLSQVADYVRPLSTPVFKMLKRALPGPYTFLLPAGHKVPKMLGVSKPTVGVRIPDNRITLALVQELGRPLISASIKDEDAIREYTPDPHDIYQRYMHKVDIVIDGGLSNLVPSTVIDLTGDQPQIVRQGAGPTDTLL